MAMTPTSEISAVGSSADAVPFNVACALRIELSVLVCALPNNIASICLRRDSRRVRVLAVPGARTTFFVLAPAPFNDSVPPFPIAFSLRSADGKLIFSQDLHLSQILDPDGWFLPHNFLGLPEEGTDTGDASKKRKEALRIKAAASILTDPVRELPVVQSKVLVLAENCEKSDPSVRGGSFDDFPRARYAAPAVPIQCTIPKTKAVPFVSVVSSPRKLAFRAVRRPFEADDDEDQLIDVGDGVFAPKRNIAKLRRAATRDKSAPRLPAESGRMSLLQACSVRPVGTHAPLTIPLGKPISLERSTVLDASTILDQDFQYIDDVSISDSESDDLEDDDEEEEGEEEGDEDEVNFETSKSLKSDGGASSSVAEDSDFTSCSGAPEDRLEQAPPLNRVPSGVAAVSNIEKFLSLPEAPVLRKTPSRGVDTPVARSISDSPGKKKDCAMSYAPLMIRVDKAEREKTFLQRELISAQAERERLLEQLRAANLISKCAELEAELNTLRAAHEKLRKDYAEMAEGRQESESVQRDSVPKEKVDALIDLGQKYKKQMKDTQQENDRLLNVIGQLSKELERQPGSHQILEELATAKTNLVVEKAENERLARELAVLKSNNSPRSVVDGSTGF